MKIRCFALLVLMAFTPGIMADKIDDNDKKWWERRQQRQDIFFPHNAHLDALKERGDVCMVCHPFTAIKQSDTDKLKELNVIANEPLEVICHECHLIERSAPMACETCHPDIDKIRPADHTGDYTYIHGEAGRRDEADCRACHLDLSFCTDCHFRRNASRLVMHPLGYRNSHGLDARMRAVSCSSCHNASYCRECHRGGAR